MRNRPSSASVKKVNTKQCRGLLEAQEESGKMPLWTSILGLDESKKKSATKFAFSVFLNARIETDRSGGKLKRLHRGLRKKISFKITTPEANIELVDIPEVTKVRSKFSELTDELDSIHKILEEEMSKEEIRKDNVTLLFATTHN